MLVLVLVLVIGIAALVLVLVLPGSEAGVVGPITNSITITSMSTSTIRDTARDVRVISKSPRCRGDC